jgi:RNA polymerase sigma-70 factor (ECF subfamily)
MVDEQDTDRLQRARALDTDILAGIYDEYHPLIYRYIFRRVGKVETAQDLSAGVFQRFLQALDEGGGPERNLRAWLYRTAHNAVVDHYRRQEHRQHLPLKENVVDGGNSPARLTEERLTTARLREALRTLTPDQQQVVVLKFVEGLSNREVATILGKSEGAVKSLQHRALAALGRRLEETEERMLV